MDSVVSISTIVVNNHVSVKTAAEISGYSSQYLRRLLRCCKLNGFKIGQVWLIDMQALDFYLESVHRETDRRFGPK
jgi:hypothetical protein